MVEQDLTSAWGTQSELYLGAEQWAGHGQARVMCIMRNALWREGSDQIELERSSCEYNSSRAAINKNTIRIQRHKAS